jgi:hypothetical protein
MSITFENARLTNDASQRTYTVTLLDGLVKSIVPSSDAGKTVSGVNDGIDAERIDLQGDYIGELGGLFT